MTLLKRILYRIMARRPEPGAAAFRPASDISICLCGDFMLDRRIEPYLSHGGLMYPFKNLFPLLAEYDIRALNLETPISDKPGKKHPGKKFNFQAPGYIARILARAGIGYVSLSNNHILDFGAEVAKDTVQNLNKYGIRSSGLSFAKNPAVIELNGYKIAFLSFMDGECLPNGFEKTASVWGMGATTEIKTAAKKADLVIVAMHWGTELAKSADNRQRQIARKIIDAGADVVWGHHPHVIQETERYKDGVIFYSLGNFIFSHLTPSITRGMVAGIHIKDGKIADISKHIINNDNYRVHYAPIVTSE